MTLRLCPKCGLYFSAGEVFCPRDGRLLQSEVEHAAAKARKIVPEGALIGGRYRIVRELGSGAMGTVFLAIQETLQREVAVKFLHPELSRELDEVRRFLVEARAAGRVDHPNVVAVFDFGRDPKGHYFLVMEYVTGKLLSDLIEQEGPFPLERVVHILRQILLAVAMAHKQQIIHRDLKPQNIICTERRGDRNFVKVLDFGIAKIVGDEKRGGPITQGFALGTPEYMSPEQVEAKGLDHRCDLYSVGVMAFEMLSGQIPFGGEIDDVFRGHLREAPPPIRELCPDLHEDMAFLVETLMAKKPDDRFSRAEAVLNVLGRISEELKEASQAEVVPNTLVVDQEPLPPTRDSQPAPTTFQVLPVKTAWDTPELIAEIGRLAQLWERRVAEVAEILWGADSRPPQVLQWQATIHRGEQRIFDIETRIAVLRDEVETLDTGFREEMVALRRKRLDLVARQGSAWALLEEAKLQSVEFDDEDPLVAGIGSDTLPSIQLEVDGDSEPDGFGDTSRDGEGDRKSGDTHKEKTRPEVTEDSVPTLLTELPDEELEELDERVSTSVDFALPDDLQEQNELPADTLLSDPADFDPQYASIELLALDTDLLEAQHALVSLERKIAVLDIRLGRLMEERQKAVVDRERAILAEIELVNEERTKLAPAYQELASFVGLNTDRRPELGEHIASVQAVARAIRHYQLVLQTVESS